MTHSIVFLFLLSPFQCIDVHYTHGTRPQNSSNSSNFTTPPYLPTIYPEQHSRISTAGRVYCTLYSFFFKSCSIPGSFPPPFLFLYSVGAVWVRRRWQSQRSVRALDTCNYAQVKWTLARSLFFFFSLFHLSFSFLLFMAKFYPAYISFCASARRERERAREKRVLRFLGLQFISCPGVNKKGRKSRTFFFPGLSSPSFRIKNEGRVSQVLQLEEEVAIP